MAVVWLDRSMDRLKLVLPLELSGCLHVIAPMRPTRPRPSPRPTCSSPSPPLHLLHITRLAFTTLLYMTMVCTYGALVQMSFQSLIIQVYIIHVACISSKVLHSHQSPSSH